MAAASIETQTQIFFSEAAQPLAQPLAHAHIPLPLNVIRDTLISLGSEVNNNNLRDWIAVMEECWQDPEVRASWTPTNIKDLDEWLDMDMMTSSARWHGWDWWVANNEEKGPHAFDIFHDANIPYEAGAPTYSVVIKNLSTHVTVQDLLHVAGEYGAVTRIHRPKNKDGSSKKFAIISYLHREDARRAISWSKLLQLDGDVIEIQECA